MNGPNVTPTKEPLARKVRASSVKASSETRNGSSASLIQLETWAGTQKVKARTSPNLQERAKTKEHDGHQTGPQKTQGEKITAEIFCCLGNAVASVADLTNVQ